MNLDTFWSLPSPKRWLDEVVNKINEEHLCVLQAPSVLIESFGIKDKCESIIRESIHWSTSSAIFAVESDSFPKNYPEFLDQVKDWYGLTIFLCFDFQFQSLFANLQTASTVRHPAVSN